LARIAGAAKPNALSASSRRNAAIYASMTARIAAASGSAFLLAQLLDVTVFNWLRRQSWWRAPFVSSILASVIDTAMFFGIAFISTGLPWVTWALGDLAVKLAFALFCLAPYRLLMFRFGPAWTPSRV
jgi:uncharacterized integral membrane protein (TIGR00697 family)